MAPRAPMKKPTALELIKMISGPRVDILVGPDKKHYSVPKDLFCYYSPYFDRCFNGSFKEAQEQKLELVEDNIEDFDRLLECLLRGTLDAKKGPQGSDETINDCLEFLKYADKYDLGDVSEVVYKPLSEAVRGYTNWFMGSKAARPLFATPEPFPPPDMKLKRPHGFQPKDVELVFHICPVGSPVRTLVAQAVLAFSASQGLKGISIFQPVADHIKDFAAEILFVISQLSPTNFSGHQQWLQEVRRP